MSRICDNCRRPVLDSDTVCWHCGWNLPPVVTQPADEIPEEPVEAQEQERPLDPTPVPLTIYYGAVTLLIIMGLIWVMNSLANSPTVMTLGSQDADFVQLQDPQQRFSISIPVGWQWSFQEDLDGQRDAGIFVEDGRWLTQANAPLGTLVSDSEQIFQAGNDSVLLLITISERLNQLSGEQIVTSLGQDTFEGITVQGARQARSSAGEIVTLFNVTHEEPAIRCRQLWAPGETAAYLVSACTDINDAAIFQNEIDATLDSLRIRNR